MWTSRNPMITRGLPLISQCGRSTSVRSGIAPDVSVTSNAMKMLRARLYHIACEWFETRNETFWIAVPAIGVTLLMATIVFLTGS